jgi:hypothetical protein
MTPEKEIFYFLNGLVFVMHKLMGFSRWWLFGCWFYDGGEVAEEEVVLE